MIPRLCDYLLVLVLRLIYGKDNPVTAFLDDLQTISGDEEWSRSRANKDTED